MTGSADKWWVRSKRNQLMNNSRWLVDLRVRRVRACAARPYLRTARRRRRLRSADFTRGDCVVLIVRPRRRRNNAIILYTNGSAERMDYISKTVTSPFLDAFDSVFIRHSKCPNSFQSVFTFRSTEITRLLQLRDSPIESETLVSHQQSRYCRSMWVVISSLLSPSVSKLNYSPWIPKFSRKDFLKVCKIRLNTFTDWTNGFSTMWLREIAKKLTNFSSLFFKRPFSKRWRLYLLSRLLIVFFPLRRLSGTVTIAGYQNVNLLFRVQILCHCTIGRVPSFIHPRAARLR